MAVNLLVDGNYILYKNIHSLHSQKSLYGELHRALEVNIKRLINKFPWANIYIASDSLKPSWRKNIHSEYKGKRVKDEEIDWEFCFNTFTEYKEQLKDDKRVNVYEGDSIEGDDWIRHIVKMSNAKNESCVIVGSDADLQQLLDYRLNPAWINIQWRENYTKEKIFFPQGYELFVKHLREKDGDIFELTDDDELLKLINEWLEKSDCTDIDKEKMLFVKILNGDTGDNILSAYTKESKSGRMMGIGEKTCEKIYESYKEEYPEDIVFDKGEWIRNVVPHIEVFKKLELDKNGATKLMKNLVFNTKLIHLSERHLPQPILESIKSKF